MTTRAAGLVLIACLVVGCATAPRPGPIDAYVTRQLAALHLPGAAVAIVIDGEVVHARGYGVADLEHDVPVTTSTVFELGSLTKQFTALAVLQLVEDGTLGLDDPLGLHLDGVPDAWRGITIRHLLGHTSGIQNHVGVPGFMDGFQTSVTGTTRPDRDELVRRFLALPLEFEPGASWAYDNTGYYLLGVLVERVTGRSYWDQVTARILAPAGMTATRSTDPRPIVRGRAAGYVWTPDGFRNQPALPPFVALSAGALMSTLDDMIRWDAALRAGRLLPRTPIEALWTPATLAGGAPLPMDYGFGWFVDTYRGRRIVQHSGGTPGFSSTIYRFLDDRVTVIVLANHADRVLDQLAIDLAGLARPALRRADAAPDPAPERTALHARVVRALLAGQPAPARLSPALATFLTTTTGRGMWQWYAEHGALTALAFSSQEPVGADLVVRYRATLGTDRYWLSLRLTADGAIAQLRWW